jgi:hypothetical protein
MPFSREAIVGKKDGPVGKDILTALNDSNAILNKAENPDGSPENAAPQAPSRGNIPQLTKSRSFSVWFNPDEYAYLRSCFCRKGRKFGPALKDCILYVAERIDAGKLVMGRTGLRPRRPPEK